MKGIRIGSNVISASDVNPFDTSYSEFQLRYDRSIMDILSNAGKFIVNVSHTQLITDFGAYERDPNLWVAEQIVNGTSEMSSTTMVLTSSFSYPVAFTFGVGRFRPLLYYKTRSIRDEYNIYYIPFSGEVWISLFCLLLIITVTLTFILGRETKLPHETPYDIIARIADEKHDHGVEWKEASKITAKDSLRQRERWEMGEILLIAIGVLSQQGSARDPSTSAARTLLLVMFLLALVSYTAYSASVISLVSLIPTTEKEQQSTAKSVPSNREITLQDTNFFRHSFPFFNEEVSYAKIERGISDSIEGKSVFVADEDTSLTYIHGQGFSPERKCTLARVFLGYDYNRVFALRKNSSYKELINVNILRLREFGIMSRERKRFFDVRYPCSFREKSSVSGFVSFNIDDIKPALSLWGCGFLMSIFFLLLEFFTFSSGKIIRKKILLQWTGRYRCLYSVASKFFTVKPKTQINESKRMNENDADGSYRLHYHNGNENVGYIPFLE